MNQDGHTGHEVCWIRYKERLSVKHTHTKQTRSEPGHELLIRSNSGPASVARRRRARTPQGPPEGAPGGAPAGLPEGDPREDPRRAAGGPPEAKKMRYMRGHMPENQVTKCV